MTAVLLDIHSFVWSLFMSSALSPAARQMIQAADAVYVTPISFYDITQKHRLGKWPELDPVIDRLLPLWQAHGALIAPYSAGIAVWAGAVKWDRCDPFNRMIAATAMALACALISKGTAFDDLNRMQGWKGRFWEARLAV